MRKDLTLLLLTHNRLTFLMRSLAYYTGLPYRLIVLDSSEESAAQSVVKYPEAEYVHCPEFGYLGISQKIKMGVGKVQSPYMALVADDDFMLHDALYESLQFLLLNPDYVLCHGYSLMYLAEAQKIHYFLRDKKVVENYECDLADQRLMAFMANYIPPAYAVTRTDLMKRWYEKPLAEFGMEYQEFGHAFHLIVGGKAKILDRPYIVRELNYPVSDHGTDLLTALHWDSGEQAEQKHRFIDFLSERLVEAGYEQGLSRRLVKQSFKELSDCLSSQRSLTLKEIFHSEWEIFSEQPRWCFQPEQFVEMPFYNRHFFDQLEVLDLLMRVFPAGKLQLQQLLPIQAAQRELLDSNSDVNAEDSFWQRLYELFQGNPFSLDVISRLILDCPPDMALANKLECWSDKLIAASQVLQAFERLDTQGRRAPNLPIASVNDEVERWLSMRRPNSMQRSLIGEFVEQHKGGARFLVLLLDLDGGEDKLARTIKSLEFVRATYTNLDVVILGVNEFSYSYPRDKLRFIHVTVDSHVATMNMVVGEESFDWLILLQAGEQLSYNGFMSVALELIGASECRAICCDELYWRPDGSLGAALRPGFNLDLLLSFPLGSARHWLFRRDVFIEVGGFNLDCAGALEFDLLLRLIECGINGLAHISEPLLTTMSPVLIDNADEQAAVLQHLRRRGYDQARLLPDLPARYRIQYGHLSRPLVSIIIPTKDQLPILQRCVESLLENTSYANYELLIVDNASEAPEAKAWLAGVEQMGEDKVRVLRYPHPFNYSAINNMAAREARGEYLVLLNNDTAIISDSWLDELLNHALRPEVGIVGAKLLYPDGRIQHAGVVLGLRGPAEHPFIGNAMDAPGYMQRLQVDQNYSAVTAACLMIRKSIYDEVGGLDEEAFKVSYNDVDLCLKVGRLGYLIVLTPHAVVMHEGSLSQKQVDSAALEEKRQRFLAEQDAMYEKWLPQLAHDPAYNDNLALNDEGFALERNAGLTWRPMPWRPLPVVLAHNADPWGCGNYRLIKPFEAMRDEALIDGALSERLLSVPELARLSPDVIVFQRQTNLQALELMAGAKRFSPAFKIYELDDYLPNTPMKSVHRASMSKDLVKLLRQGLSFVDRFVVSTQALADEFKGYHSRIHVVENRLPLDWWGNLALSVNDGTRPRVGWAGGVGHQGDLEMIADVVRDLASEVDWVFFGMCPDKLRPFVAEFHPGVDISSYPQFLANLRLDLAIAPLEDNIFNACKSNLRLLEYGICGFPVIASDIVSYRGSLPVALVKNRYRDWVEAIRCALAERNELRADGQRLQAAVKREWMLSGDNLKLWQRAWLPD